MIPYLEKQHPLIPLFLSLLISFLILNWFVPLKLFACGERIGWSGGGNEVAENPEKRRFEGSLNGIYRYDPLLNLFGNIKGFDRTSPESRDTEGESQTSPVILIHGNKIISCMDFSKQHSMKKLPFIRTFNSYSLNGANRGKYMKPFGYGWTHNYNQFLYFRGEWLKKPSMGYVIRYISSDGKGFYFDWNNNKKAFESRDNDESLAMLEINPLDQTFLLTTRHQERLHFTKPFPKLWKHDFISVLDWIEDRNGNRIELIYDSQNPLILKELTDPYGRNIEFFYDNYNHIKIMRDCIGREMKYFYEDSTVVDARLVRVEGPEGYFAQYDYISLPDSLSKVSHYTDPRAQAGWKEASFTYNNDGRCSQEKDANDEIWSYWYRSSKQSIGFDTTYTIDPMGVEKILISNNKYRVTRIIYPNAQDFDMSWIDIAYNSKLCKELVVNENGHSIFFAHDTLSSDLLYKVNAVGDTFFWEYNSTFNYPTWIKTERGDTAIFKYDSTGNLIEKSLLSDPSARYTYDYTSTGQLEWRRDPGGDTISYTYDSFDNLISIHEPLSKNTYYGYDLAGRKIYEVNAIFDTTRWSYDALDRITKIKNPVGDSLIYSYDQNNNISMVTDERGNTTDFIYDARGYLESVVMASGDTFSQVIAPNQRIALFHDALGNQTKFSYETGRGRLDSIKNALNESLVFGYDKLGNLIREVSTDGDTMLYSYNPMRKITRVDDPLNYSTFYEYDKGGNLVKINDARNNSATLTHDPDNRLTSLTDAEGFELKYEYDSEGRLVKRTDGENRVTIYVYDALNRLIQVRYPDSTKVNLEYDAIGNIVRLEEQGYILLMDYDPLYRPILEKRIFPGNTDTLEISCTYDARGNLIKVVDPFSDATSYAYDSDNCLVSIDDDLTGSFDVTYTPNNFIKTMTYPNNYRLEYFYDALNRPDSLVYTDPSSSIISASKFIYDQAGNVLTKIISALSGNESIDYTYDKLRRLLSEHHSLHTSWNSDYSYDASGNRHSSGSLPKIFYTYDKANRMISANSDSFFYDANGNMIARKISGVGVDSFFYDFENKLKQVKLCSGEEFHYFVSYFGYRLMAEDSRQNKTYFLYSGGNPLLDLDSNLQKKVKYLTGSGQNKILSLADNSHDVLYFHFDELGSILNLSDTLGQVAGTYSYAAFGSLLYKSGQKTGKNPFGFTGCRLDTETGLIDFYSRTYYPEHGRYSTKRNGFYDISIPDLYCNLYLYAINNPLSFIGAYATSSLRGLTPPLHGAGGFPMGSIPETCHGVDAVGNGGWPLNTLEMNPGMDKGNGGFPLNTLEMNIGQDIGEYQGLCSIVAAPQLPEPDPNLSLIDIRSFKGDMDNMLYKYARENAAKTWCMDYRMPWWLPWQWYSSMTHGKKVTLEYNHLNLEPGSVLR